MRQQLWLPKPSIWIGGGLLGLVLLILLILWLTGNLGGGPAIR